MTSPKENPTPLNRIAELDMIFSSIVRPYDEADRNTLQILVEQCPDVLGDADTCVSMLMEKYGGEFSPGTASYLFRRANRTAKDMARLNSSKADKWHPFSELYDKYHGSPEFRSRTQPGTPEHKEQMLRAQIFDSALYVVAQMQQEAVDPNKWI